jgi:cation diffusion facilitator CzcD-associated flavoprotein CzcO
MVSATWSETAGSYTLIIKDTQTGSLREVRAQVVISAIGVFHHPKWPEIPGRQSFKGTMLHAQSWDHSIGLAGKRVGLIGNGCAGYSTLAV